MAEPDFDQYCRETKYAPTAENCPICHKTYLLGTIHMCLDPGVTAMHDLTYEQKLRIEALRAAARVVCSTYILATENVRAGEPEDITVQRATLLVAEQFYRWLESNDRDG